MSFLQLSANSGEQLALGQTVEVTDEAILHRSNALDGVRVSLLEQDDPLDIEFFVDDYPQTNRFPSRYVDVYPLDGSDKVTTVKLPTELTLNSSLLRVISSVVLSERARTSSPLSRSHA